MRSGPRIWAREYLSFLCETITPEENDGGKFVAQRVALLTNFLPHYRIPLLEALQSRVGQLRVFLSARMERDRDWRVHWGKLDVVVQRSLSFTHTFRNVHGYRDSSQIHIPWDTLLQLRRYRPDAIISGEFGLRTVFSVLYRIVSPQTRLILWATCSDHTEATRGTLRRFLRKWLVRHVDGIFLNGAGGARYVAALGFTGPTFPVPYTIDNAAFAGRSDAENDGVLRLLYSGQMIERKGLHLFLPVLSEWCRRHPDRRIVLRIAGDGPERARLQSLPGAPNLRLEILGNVAPEKLPAVYHASSIFVFPTLGDEWGTVVNEALCAGLPVLGSNYSQAVEELVTEGVNGWTYFPDRGAETCDTLDRALSASPEVLEAMSQQARATMENLTPERIASIMAGAVADLTRSPRAVSC
jgi:glycosyltransferase involved in cell wall biosynthesis